MSNRLNDRRVMALEQQIYAEAECIFAENLKQFPVSRKAVERIERNIKKLALAVNQAASKPAENVIQADDDASWHKAVDLMGNIFLCHHQTAGGTEFSIVEHFPAHGTNEIWNRGLDAIQVLRVFINEQRRALEFGMQDVETQVKEFLAEKYCGLEMGRVVDRVVRRFNRSALQPYDYAYEQNRSLVVSSAA
jgi:hypothetical protein